MSTDMAIPTEGGGGIIPASSFHKESLTSVRLNGLKWISLNIKTPSLRKAAIRELAEFLTFEKLRRREELIGQHLEKTNELQIRLLDKMAKARQTRELEEAKLKLVKAQTCAQIANHLCKARRSLSQPATDVEQVLQQAKKELIKQRIQRSLRRHTQDARMDDLRNQNLHRAAFLKYVRNKFPEMEQEILDQYDRDMYEFNHNSQSQEDEE